MAKADPLGSKPSGVWSDRRPGWPKGSSASWGRVVAELDQGALGRGAGEGAALAQPGHQHVAGAGGDGQQRVIAPGASVAVVAGALLGFTLQGDSPSPYIVNTPSQEGVYPFSGMLRDSDRKDTPVGGTSWGRSTVQQPSNPGPLCAQRTTRPPFLSRRRPFSPGSPAGPPCH